MPPDILIYDEHPASTWAVHTAMKKSFARESANVIRITANDIRAGVLQKENSRIFVLPGILGENSAYPAQLDGAALKNIHDFVERRNNVLLTICAGTYFICRETRYTPPWGTAKRESCLSPLFDACASGPLVTNKPRKGDPEISDVRVVNIRFKDMSGNWHKTGIAYGNGPAIYPDRPDDPGMDILAIYEDVAGQPPAIIRHARGAGAIYMCGILPETGYIEVSPQPDMKRFIQIMDTLKPHETGRVVLWNSLVKRIRQDLAL